MEQTILFINDTVSPEGTETHRLRPFSLFNSSTHRSLPLTLIASVGEKLEVGKEGDLCWHIREDLRHFKELTMGGAVIMGRSTWESLPRRPLPGRKNIVITGRADYDAPGATIAGSLEEAIEEAKDTETFIIGGESVYCQALPLASRLELTRIYASEPEADKYFPEFSDEEWTLEKSSEEMETEGGLRFRYETYKRRT